MVHSVELLFDEDTDAAVRLLWTALAEVGIRSLAGRTSPSNRPHVTLTVAESMDDRVDESLATALEGLPLACVLGAPAVFGGGRSLTLVRMVVPSAELVALQAEVHRICLPHMPKGALPHAAPGHWTPHVTLARRVRPDVLPAALGRPAMFREVRANAVRLRHWDGNNRVEHRIG